MHSVSEVSCRPNVTAVHFSVTFLSEKREQSMSKLTSVYATNGLLEIHVQWILLFHHLSI